MKFVYIQRARLKRNGSRQAIARVEKQLDNLKRQMSTARKYLIDKRGDFPTGLLYLVEATLKDSSCQYVLDDTRRMPPLGATLPATRKVTPYPEQSEAADAALSNGRGIIVAPTGVGKTCILSLIIDRLKVPTLVVVPGIGLKTQITESLREVFGALAVGPLVKGKREYLVTVENVDGLPEKEVLGFDCVVIDEFHHSGAATYQNLNIKCWNNIYFKFGLTATPFRSRSEERLLLESVLSKVIYQIPYAVAVTKGYIVPMEVYYVELPALEGYKSRNKRFQTVYRELVVERDDRNEMIADFAANLINSKASTLILTKHIEHGLILRRKLAERLHDVPFAEGANELNNELVEAFNASGSGCLIGTTGVLGEGRDTKPCEWVILSGGGKSKNQMMQNIGRGFRRYPGKESCKILLIRDQTHHWLEDHFQETCKNLLREYGTVPIRLEL